MSTTWMLPEGFSDERIDILGNSYIVRMRDNVRFFYENNRDEELQCERCLYLVPTQDVHLHCCVAWTTPLSSVSHGFISLTTVGAINYNTVDNDQWWCDGW